MYDIYGNKFNWFLKSFGIFFFQMDLQGLTEKPEKSSVASDPISDLFRPNQKPYPKRNENTFRKSRKG